VLQKRVKEKVKTRKNEKMVGKNKGPVHYSHFIHKCKNEAKQL
jgi:hypothetical protein